MYPSAYYYSLQLLRKKLPKPVDLSALLDFNLISQDFNKNGVLPDGIRVSEVGSPVFCIENRPGESEIPKS